MSERAREYAAHVLETATEIDPEHDRELETTIEAGKPDRRIIERASDGEYGAIVVGNRG